MFKNRFALALVLILSLVFSGVVLAAGDPGWANQPTDPESNNPATWEAWAATNGETWICNKLEYDAGGFVVTVIDGIAYYTMPAPDDGYVWRLLKVKAGTIDTLYWDPIAGELYPSDRSSISHVILCQMMSDEYEELAVSKTADTSFTRTHLWDIDKFVTTDNEYTHEGFPKVWLYTDGSGDEIATWTVDVTYEGYLDSGFNVSGEITIENTGTLPAEILSVDDVLAGTLIDVDCGVDFPYTLPVDATLTCSYSEDVAEAIEGFNVATVTTAAGNEYVGAAEIIWGEPTTEINATVNVQDISGLFGTVPLGTVTEPNDAQFTYTKAFAWADYGRYNCGDFVYDNTATIVGTEQSASATLLVNVQCYVGETAWAANGDVAGVFRYNPRGGNWATYVEYFGEEKTTTLFAGQTMPAGTVTFSAVVDGMVTITVNLTVPWTFQVASVLAVQDYDMAPSGNPSPGQFAWKVDATGTTASIVVPVNNFYGVHADVEQPDPDFGP